MTKVTDSEAIPADGICHQHLIMGCTLNHTKFVDSEASTDKPKQNKEKNMSKRATKEFHITITAKKEPLYNLPSNDQMYFTPDGKLFVVYDDDHDEDPTHLHDVTDQYNVSITYADRLE